MQQTNDHEIIIALVAASMMFLLLGSFILIFILYHKKRRSDHAQEKAHLKALFQEELLRTQMEIQEHTFKNISQEIHDNIGQCLTLAKLNLSTFNIEEVSTAKSKVDSIKELVGKAIQDLRDLSKSLNTDSILSGGIVKALQLELSLIDRAGIFHTELVVAGKADRIDPKKELIVFRIIQESISNIIKHSKATAINAEIVFEDHFLKVSVKDNGIGFSNDPARSSDGSGLRNMKSRAELIGGTFNLNTGLNGTTILVTIPIDESDIINSK